MGCVSACRCQSSSVGHFYRTVLLLKEVAVELDTVKSSYLFTYFSNPPPVFSYCKLCIGSGLCDSRRTIVVQIDLYIYILENLIIQYMHIYSVISYFAQYRNNLIF
jgi:hypothetical protein